MYKYFTNVQTAEQAKARYRELCREYHPDAHRDTLKALGFSWAAKKQAWYYHKGEYKLRGRKEIPLTISKQGTDAPALTACSKPALRSMLPDALQAPCRRFHVVGNTYPNT